MRAVQLPGREQRLIDPPFTRLQPLVEELERVLEPYLDVPYALFGHSLGAFIVFELARALRRHHTPQPSYLFVAGSRAPQLPSKLPPIHALPDPEFLNGLRRYEGTPEEALQHAELMELLLPTLRADFSLTETYHYLPEPLLQTPISVFGGLEDPVVETEELSAWREQTCGQFKLRLLPGDHFFVQSAREELLRAIVEDLQAGPLG
jgi:medium-chain acyl-[acyl-carrier-protein] hydrolase